ncbi:uncharacterized protein Fot_18618 [Forsythia ovata]|uniref:Uncharacterized protein n=1 Tax=Forsythia ovata TaxID=205694 RepID=A0ABD1VIR3_9LAMI
MGRNKEKKQNKFIHFMTAPIRILIKAREFYMNTMFDCAKRIDQTCVVQPQLHRDLSGVGLFKEGDNGDVMEIIRRASARNGGGVRVDVDGKGNLLLKPPSVEAAERSYSVGVGRIGRIDEEAPCDFKESDVNKYLYRRCASYAV